MLTHLDKNDKSIGSKYNVYWELGSFSRTGTFSGVLESIDDTYFWFRIEGRVSCIRQEIVVFMIALPERKQVSD